MIVNLIKNIEGYIISRSEAVVKKKNWILIVSLLLPFSVYFFSFPSFERLPTEFASLWENNMRQVEHPLTPYEYHPESHESKMAFRLFIPIVAHILNFGMPGILILQGIFGIFLFYYTTLLIKKITNDDVIAFLVTLSLSFTLAGRASFTEVRGLYDGVALFFLVFAMYHKNPFAIFSGVFLCAWVDERGLIASILVFLYWLVILTEKKEKIIICLSIVVAWIFYLILRLFLNRQFGLSTASGAIGIKIFVHQLNNLPLAVWAALEGNWLLVSAAIYILFRQGRYFSGMF